MPGDIQEVNAAVLISSVLDVVSGPILYCMVESDISDEIRETSDCALNVNVRRRLTRK